jgi:hypothetical protein
VFGPYWAGLDAPRHLYIYSRHTLERYLALTGFEIQDVVSFTGGHSVLSISVEEWLDENVGSERWRTWLERAIRSVPLRLMTLPYYTIAGRLNQSSVMTIFAQRHP